MENQIKINKLKILLCNRKSILFIIISGTILFITAFFVINYSITYKNTSVKNENLDNVKPREMVARDYFNPSKEDIFKYLKEGKFDMRYNLYLIELNKKYLLVTSPLFFIILILAFTSKLKKYPKIGFAIIVFSCLLYWFLLFSCQTISIRRYLGKFGFLIMWLPNIIILPITFIMYKIKNRLLSLWTKSNGHTECLTPKWE